MPTSYRYRVPTYSVRRRQFDGTSWVDLGEVTYPTTLLEAHVKSSVDTGCFKPGTYRTNPYEIGDDVYDMDLDLYFCKVYNLSGVPYEITLKGNVFGPGISQIKDTSIPTALTKLESEALLRAYAKLGQGRLSLGEDLGEIRETIEMLKRPLSSLKNFLGANNQANRKKLIKLLDSLKKRELGSLTKGAWRQASNLWLEYRYGWSPLVCSIADILKELERQQQLFFDPLKIRSVHSRVKGSSVYTKADYNITVATGYIYGCPRSYKDDYAGVASVQYRQTQQLSTLANLGLSPRFIPELAWELTKLSFVWDWFFTIGPYIQSFRYKPEITVLGATSGRKLSRKATTKLGSYRPTGYTGSATPLLGEASWEYRYFKRSIPSYRPLTPVFRAGDVIDLKKSIDSAALILQAILGKKRY